MSRRWTTNGLPALAGHAAPLGGSNIGGDLARFLAVEFVELRRNVGVSILRDVLGHGRRVEPAARNVELVGQVVGRLGCNTVDCVVFMVPIQIIGIAIGTLLPLPPRRA